MTIWQITWSGRSLIYSRKSARPRVKPWGTLALKGCSWEDFLSRTTWSQSNTEKTQIKINYWTRNFQRLKFVKKTSMPNLVESLVYIKCYSASSPRFENPYKFVGYNCLSDICNWLRRPKTILGLWKKASFL